MTSLFSGFSSHVPPHPRLLSQWFFPPQLPSHHTHLGWLCPPHGFQWCCLLAFFFLCSPPIHLILSTWVSNKAFKLCPKHNFTFIPSSDLLLLYEWQLFFFFFFRPSHLNPVLSLPFFLISQILSCINSTSSSVCSSLVTSYILSPLDQSRCSCAGWAWIKGIPLKPDSYKILSALS